MKALGFGAQAEWAPQRPVVFYGFERNLLRYNRVEGLSAGAGVRRVFLAVNYLAEQFEERLGDGKGLGVDIVYVREKELMGSAGGLSLLPEVPTGPVFVSNGDLVTTVDYGTLFAYHWRHGGAITVTGVEHRTHVPYGVLRSVDRILFMREGQVVASQGRDEALAKVLPAQRGSEMPRVAAVAA